MSRAPLAVASPLADYDAEDCLVLGIGNVARRDDGLGWAFLDRLEDAGLCPRATRERTYQLGLEHAELISRFARVLVVDATRDPAVASYRVERAVPRLESAFTSHALSLPTVLAIAQRCFGPVPEVTLLAIRGHAWDLRSGLTRRAADHLATTLAGRWE